MLEFVAPTDPVLNKPTKLLTPAEIKTSEIQQLIDQMLAFANDRTTPSGEKGSRLVGLAANQVARHEAIILVDDAEPDRWSGNLLVMINPRILQWAGNPVRWWHGCFSTGPICGALELPGDRLWVEYQDMQGKYWHHMAEGARAVHVLWHEIEHLHGRRFPEEVLKQGGELLTVYPHEYPQFGLDADWPRKTPAGVWSAMQQGRPWEHLL